MKRVKNSIFISDSLRTLFVDSGSMCRAFDAVLREMGVSGRQLSVTLVGDHAMRGLNREYRGVDATTDVLSFSMADGEHVEGEMLGDIVISLPAIVRQSTRPHLDGRPTTGTTQRELALMSIHGVLHLLGFDHERGERESASMIEKERELFEATWRVFPAIRQR